MILSGNVLFINNVASNHGAISIFESYLHFSEDWLNIKPFCVTATSFCWNMVANGKSMGSYCHNNTLSCNNYSDYDLFHISIEASNGSRTANESLIRISSNEFTLIL